MIVFQVITWAVAAFCLLCSVVDENIAFGIAALVIVQLEFIRCGVCSSSTKVP